MKEITDDYVKEMMLKTKEYIVVILKATDKLKEPGTDKIIWER